MIKTLKKATLRNDVATFEHYYTAEEINVFMIVVNKIQTNQISEFSGLNGLRFKIKEIRENIGYSANFEKILDEIIDEANKWDENKDFGWENFRVEGYSTEEFFIQSMYRYFLEQSGIEDNSENRKYFEDIKRDIQNDFIVTIKKEWLESIKAQGIFWEKHPNLTINLIKANVARTMHLKKNK